MICVNRTIEHITVLEHYAGTFTRASLHDEEKSVYKRSQNGRTQYPCGLSLLELEARCFEVPFRN